MAEPFPEDVDRFIDANVESVDQLEILRILGEEPGREWSARALAGTLNAPAPEVTGSILALHSRGLLAAERRGQELICRYGPRSMEVEQVLGRLLQLYRERPVSLIKSLYARAADPLRKFSDAFRLREEDA